MPLSIGALEFVKERDRDMLCIVTHGGREARQPAFADVVAVASS